MRRLGWPVIVLALSVVCPDRGIAEQLGAKPAALTTPYQSEYAWAVGESATDIAEMAAAAARRPRPARVAPPAGVTPWNPDLLVPLAKELLGPAPPRPPAEPVFADQYPLLIDLNVQSVARASATVSEALKKNLRSARAHEAAALVAGAFALRESADALSDERWALNRMTAHLAMAAALRDGQAAPGLDGQLARVILLALSGRDTTALNALVAIRDNPADEPLNVWKRALRIRITQDWRVAAQPAKAWRLEKLEYFRARRIAMNTVRAGQELSDIGERPAADVARIVQAHKWAVEDGGDIVRPALGFELLEISEVHQLVRGRPLPAALPAEIMNVRAGRLMSEGEPRVIPWGAWAEFFQRHAGMYISKIDAFFRGMQGSPGRADEIKGPLDALLGHLTLFPVATVRRTKGKGTEADLTYIARAIDLATRAPELITDYYWSFLEVGSRFEMVSRAMPVRSTWFASASVEVPYRAGVRTALGRMPMPALEALVNEASSDLPLLFAGLSPRPNNQALVDRILALLQSRQDYDLRAIDYAANWSRDSARRIAWRRYGCSLSVHQCLSLAAELAYGEDEAGAAAEYERAFKSPALDAVTMSNSTRWLVKYYERNRQLDRALDLAERSAAVGSGTGLATLARLYERRGRIFEAQLLYEQIAGRYADNSAELMGFYYRQAVTGGKPSYQEDWNAALKRLFPNGLQPLPATMPAQPARGVFVNKDSYYSRQLRLQAGDIIVGLDGWRVESLAQYSAIMAFAEDGVKHKISAWRGVLFTIEADEHLGMELATYPLKGWIQ